VHALRASIVIALALVLTGATDSPPAGDLLARVRGPRVAAHRGGFGFPDSNTVSRFEIARAQGVDIVETDLRLSRDGVVFMFHNSLLDGVTSCTGELSSKTAAELARCHLTGLDRGPDRFEDALAWSQGRMVIDAELKTLEVTRPAIDLVRRFKAYDWVYFQVGHGLHTYRAVRDYDARIAVEAAPRGERWLRALLATPDSLLILIQLHPELMTPEVWPVVRASGKMTSLNAWLLDSEQVTATCSAVYALGIDVAVTNSPALCAKQRDVARAKQGPSTADSTH